MKPGIQQMYKTVSLLHNFIILSTVFINGIAGWLTYQRTAQINDKSVCNMAYLKWVHQNVYYMWQSKRIRITSDHSICANNAIEILPLMYVVQCAITLVVRSQHSCGQMLVPSFFPCFFHIISRPHDSSAHLLVFPIHYQISLRNSLLSQSISSFT